MLDYVRRFADTRRIKNAHQISIEIKINVQHIAGGSRQIGDDRHVSLRQVVQQARFSRIRRPDDRDLETIANDLRPFCRFQMLLQFGANSGDIRRDAFPYGAGYVVFVGEIEFCFNHGSGMGEPAGPVIIQIRLPTEALFHCETTLHLGLCHDQLRQTFRLHQVQTAVLEGPARKLTCFRQPQAG